MTKNNLDVLEQVNPHLFRNLQQYKAGTDVQVKKAKKTDHHTLIYKGQHLISKYDPQKEAEILLKDIVYDHTNVIVLFGIGLGNLIEEVLLKNKVKTRVLVYEPDMDVLAKCLSEKNFAGLLSSQRLYIVAGYENDIADQLHHFLLTNINLVKRTETVISPGYEKIFGLQMFKSFMFQYREGSKFVMFQSGNDIEDTLIGIRHTFENIKHIFDTPAASELKDCMKGKPAICVASGPSLDQSISQLQEVGDKAVIFSADSALKVLLDHEIQPHFVTAIERIEKVYRYFFSNQNYLSDAVNLIALNVVDPRVLQDYPGDKIVIGRFMHADVWIKKFLNELIAEQIGFTVAHMNVMMAHYMGCSPIILVGQDLCYPDESKELTHSKYSVYSDLSEQERSVIRSQKTVYVEGYNGEKLYSDASLVRQLEWFNKYLTSVNNTFINATPGGAKIHNANFMDLKEVIKRYCKTRFDRNDFNMKKFKKVVENKEQGKEVILDAVQGLKKELEDILYEIRDLKKQIPFLEQLIKDKKQKKLKQKVDQFEDTIKRIWKHQVAWQLFQSINVSHGLRKFSLPTTLKVSETNQLIDEYNHYFNNYILGLVESIKVYDIILDRIPEKLKDIEVKEDLLENNP